jgi:hypothetical protein
MQDEAHICLPSVLETELFGATLAALAQATQTLPRVFLKVSN